MMKSQRSDTEKKKSDWRRQKNILFIDEIIERNKIANNRKHKSTENINPMIKQCYYQNGLYMAEKNQDSFKKQVEYLVVYVLKRH